MSGGNSWKTHIDSISSQSDQSVLWTSFIMRPSTIRSLVAAGAVVVLLYVLYSLIVARGPRTGPVEDLHLEIWKAPEVPAHLLDVDQTDNELAKHIMEKWIFPPGTGPRNLTWPDKTHYSQRGQSEYIDKLLKQKTDGFYIECGAASGEGLSNSLFFEKDRNWSGLLIEANPTLFAQARKLNRHAYMLNACLSPEKKASALEFREAGYIGGLLGFMDDAHKRRIIYEEGKRDSVKIQCFPLYSVLKALGVKHVDYFSLDIEGAELDIMQTFPFDEIQVDVLTVEYLISNNAKVSEEKKQEMINLMVGKYGYKVATDYDGLEDVMFIKNL